jgi:hypothetical protein
MREIRNRAVSGFIICLLLISMLLPSGCMTASALRGEQGKDISSVKAGISREEAEKVLGSPIREWVTSSSIRYSIYSYDRGIPPSIGNAASFAFMEIVSLGLVDLYVATGIVPEFKGTRITDQVAVAYDKDDIIVGLFDHFSDFDVLPADGRATK